jgi:hypothetical protein
MQLIAPPLSPYTKVTLQDECGNDSPPDKPDESSTSVPSNFVQSADEQNCALITFLDDFVDPAH